MSSLSNPFSTPDDVHVSILLHMCSSRWKVIWQDLRKILVFISDKSCTNCYKSSTVLIQRSLFTIQSFYLTFRKKVYWNILCYVKFYYNVIHRGIHEKGSGDVVSAVCFTIYTIYLSLCTQSAETTSSELFSWIPLYYGFICIYLLNVRFETMQEGFPAFISRDAIHLKNY